MMEKVPTTKERSYDFQHEMQHTCVHLRRLGFTDNEKFNKNSHSFGTFYVGHPSDLFFSLQTQSESSSLVEMLE